MARIPTIRRNMRVPQPLDDRVKEYAKEQGIAVWSTAFFELARKGLDSHYLELEKQKKSEE